MELLRDLWVVWYVVGIILVHSHLDAVKRHFDKNRNPYERQIDKESRLQDFTPFITGILMLLGTTYIYFTPSLF